MPRGRAIATEKGKRPLTVTRTFLFSDLRGYTSFVEREGDVAAARLLREYRTIVRREVARHEGAEVKTEGDSFYLVFSSTLSALDCAVSILREVDAYNQKNADGPLHLGVGLHAGEVVPYDDQFVGGAVNIAARLAAKAGAGEILVSETLRGLVRTGHGHTLADRGHLKLKGVSERVHSWRVEWQEAPAIAPAVADPVVLPGAAVPVMPSGELVCPIVVGREDELALLLRVLTAAESGERGLVLVVGEAGVGKSALAREVAKLAVERGFRLLWGAAIESEAGLPYRPFVAGLRGAAGDGDALRRFLAKTAPDAAALFPALGRKAAPEPSTSLLERHRIALAFERIFRTLAAEAPLLVVLDDLQWSDEASLALLSHLVRELPRSRIAFLCAYRSDDVRRGHPILRAIAALRRDRLLSELELNRLGPDAVGSLLHAIFKRDEPIELRDAIFERAEGNPFFTEELLRSLVESGEVVWTGEKLSRKLLGARPIPGSIRETLLPRVERLSPEAEASLAAASVVGVVFGFDLLRRVRDIPEVELARHLRECVDLQLVVESGDVSAPRYAFRHALTREVVYERLLLPERRVLHLRVAEALRDDPDVAPAVLAQHWKLGGDRARAAQAYEAAANAALAVYAPAEAVAHFESAIDARGDASAGLYEGLARAYLYFDFPKARAAAEHALALLPGGPEHLERRIALMQVAGRARRFSGDPAGAFELAGAALELVAKVPDTRAAALAYDWFAGGSMKRGDDATATVWAEKAQKVAAALGDFGIEASALTTLATCMSDRRPRETLHLLDRAAAMARRAGAADVLARVHHNGIVVSFSAEAERQRFVRIERALAFSERYRFGRDTLGSYHAFHRFAGLLWPEQGFAVEGDVEANLWVGWVRFLEALIVAARSGPTSELLGRADVLLARGLRQDEAQWALPFLAYDALLLAWAGRMAEVRSRVDQLLRIVGQEEQPDLALTVLPRGDDLPAALLLYVGDRERLVGMVGALAEIDGYPGARDMLQAFVAALDGDRERLNTSLAAAIPALEERGLRFAIAVDLWAIRQRIPLDRSSDAYRRVDERLGHAGAEWLRRELGPLAAAP